MALQNPAQWRASLNELLKDTEPLKVAFGGASGVLLLWVIKNWNSRAVRDWIVTRLVQVARATPGASAAIDAQKRQVEEDIRNGFRADETRKFLELPEEPVPHDVIIAQMQFLKREDDVIWQTGKLSGCVYLGDDEHSRLLDRACSLFSLSNPLHADVFGSVRKFEMEVIRMTAAMLGGDSKVCGTMTSGGTESILMAVKSYRDWAREEKGITRPELVIPVTAHAAFDKAGAYFGIKIVHIPLAADMRVDVAAVRAAINGNTIAIVGSAPNFPHGMIDPIAELAEIARTRKIGMHVDCCLGGFILPWARQLGYDIPPFDFSVPGVTSISADSHKYGYATKGTSIVLYHDASLRKYQYFSIATWPGGLYCSPSISGSRPGSLVAACWASLVAMGKKGYREKSDAIMKAAMHIKKGISEMREIQLCGDPKAFVIALTSKTITVFQVSEILKKKGWHLNNLMHPSALHICVTYKTVGHEQEFLDDLREAVALVVANPKEGASGGAALYGASAVAPPGLVQEVMTSYMDIVIDG